MTEGCEMQRYALGLDFGTESARALLVDVANGEIVATNAFNYPHGVIDKHLPGSEEPLPPGTALQDPADYLTAIERTVPVVLQETGISADQVVGLGLDFTACTVLPTTANGTPLCQLEPFRADHHAWVKLWKHHASQPQADRFNEIAAKMAPMLLARYGGKISSEWLFPKVLQIIEEAPHIFDAMERYVEAGDWVVWQLTGELWHNTCAAGYKAAWQKSTGFPSVDLLAALHPKLPRVVTEKLPGRVAPPGMRAGGLTKEWAERLGLLPGTPVAVPIIDAHSGVLGAGVAVPGIMVIILGTSSCHMVMAEEEVLVEGISGVVGDGIVPGLYAYEAGQASVGDIFSWFVENAVPFCYYEQAKKQGQNLYSLLEDKSSHLRPGESGLLALDWWNGCRSTLVDADLSGLLIGATLATKPEGIYRALIEATAFGTRVIIDTFTNSGIALDRIIVSGGLTKNRLLLQIYADVTGYRIDVAGSALASALGAAMLGAVAAGKAAGGYDSIAEAVKRMAPSVVSAFVPDPAASAVYNDLYAEYCRLYNYFGRGKNSVMKLLHRLRRQST